MGSECLIGMTLSEAKRVLERAPPVVEIVAQRKESKQSPTLETKTEITGKQQKKRRIGISEPSNYDVHEKENQQQKEKLFTTEPYIVSSLKNLDLRQATPASQEEMQPSNFISTSLIYAASSTSLNTSWNASMSGKAVTRAVSSIVDF